MGDRSRAGRRRAHQGGRWTGSDAFAAGSHQYKFIVDGTTWITDPTNLDVIDDGMGNTNSVLLCAP